MKQNIMQLHTTDGRARNSTHFKRKETHQDQ